MLIILEGCDGTGKSTIAKKLAEATNARIIHCTSRTPNDYLFFNRIIEASKTENIIADRFMYGQFVYQEPKDRKLKDEDLYMLETELLQVKAKVILVTADEDVVKDRLQLRSESIINQLTVDATMNRFKSIMNNSILDVMEWDTTNNPE